VRPYKTFFSSSFILKGMMRVLRLRRMLMMLPVRRQEVRKRRYVLAITVYLLLVM